MGATKIRIEIDQCIVGPLITDATTTVTVSETVVTGAHSPTQPALGDPCQQEASEGKISLAIGGAASLDRVTVLGALKAADGSEIKESLIAGPLQLAAHSKVATSAFVGGPPSGADPQGNVALDPSTLSQAPWPAPGFADLRLPVGSPILVSASNGGELGAQNGLMTYRLWVLLKKQIAAFLPINAPPWTLEIADRPDAPFQDSEL